MREKITKNYIHTLFNPNNSFWRRRRASLSSGCLRPSLNLNIVFVFKSIKETNQMLKISKIYDSYYNKNNTRLLSRISIKNKKHV